MQQGGLKSFSSTSLYLLQQGSERSIYHLLSRCPLIWQIDFSDRDTLLSTFLAASHNAHRVTNSTSSLVLYRRPHISEPRLEGESIRQHTTCLQTAQNNHPAAVGENTGVSERTTQQFLMTQENPPFLEFSKPRTKLPLPQKIIEESKVRILGETDSESGAAVHGRQTASNFSLFN